MEKTISHPKHVAGVLNMVSQARVYQRQEHLTLYKPKHKLPLGFVISKRL
jgi:hypothetical protein